MMRNLSHEKSKIREMDRICYSLWKTLTILLKSSYIEVCRLRYRHSNFREVSGSGRSVDQSFGKFRFLQ